MSTRRGNQPLHPAEDVSGPPVKPMRVKAIWTIAIRRSFKLFLQIVFAFVVLSAVLRGMLGERKTAAKVQGGAEKVTEESLLAYILGYTGVSLIFATYCAVLGLKGWFFDKDINSVSASQLHRLYARSAVAERLCIATAAYETFNVVAVLVLPEYRSVAYIGHHVTTLVLSVLAFHPWCHYYIIFFFGVATTSSLPLCMFESLDALGWYSAADAVKPLFAVSFLAIRTAYWPLVSLGFWQDALWALSSRKSRVHSTGAYILLMVANIGLTSLQFLWTGEIAKGIAKFMQD